MGYVIIEQAEDNEAYITRCKTEEDVENYQSLDTGQIVVLSESAFGNMCGAYCMGK